MTALHVVRDTTDLLPGQIRFYEAAKPPLPANAFELTTTQTVVGVGADIPTYSTTLPFTVSAPRFRLPADAVQMSYPPANATGVFDDSLPNIVLRTKALPWARTIDDSVPLPETVAPPWMAILSLTAAELGIPDAIETPAPTFPGTVQDLIDPGAGVLGPDLPNLSAIELAEPVMLVDLDLEQFQRVAPSLADLPYLAHVREVNTDHKEILGLDEDGFFSVIIGNRLMQPSSVNYHFLVSLEGFQGALPPNAPPPADTKIRLAVLAWWRVTATASRGNFIAIMQGLPHAGGVGLLQSVYTPFTGGETCPQTGPTTPAQIAAQALNLGYVPLENTMRIGEHATAWYRGPGSPVPLNPDPLGPYLRSDAAMRYDPATGIYDMSYAAAWEIGRLLALSSNALAQSLYLWRRDGSEALLLAARKSALKHDLTRLTAHLRADHRSDDQSAAHTADPLAIANRALVDLFAGLDVEAAIASGEIPQRHARSKATTEAEAPGLRSRREIAACEADPDPIGRLLATVLAP